MRLVLIAAAVAALFALASLLAAYAYGRFVRNARGAPSHALPLAEDETPLDRRCAALVHEAQGRDGLVMLSANLDAFAARALTARAAGRSLDVMYYIWRRDLTGRLLMHELLAAADRGVRVRLLLDDIGTGAHDRGTLALDRHPNIEIRLFNPNRARQGALRRGLEMALRAFRVTRRMHNKAWIADGRVAIVGGRNIGDEYFDAAEASNFRDLDLMTIGPSVQATEKIFDAFWNSEVALPVRALAPGRTAPLRRVRKRLAETASGEQARPYLERVHERISAAEMLAGGAIDWADSVDIVSDPPEKTMGALSENWLMASLWPVMAGAERNLQITSPYFIPGDKGRDDLIALAARGVQVEVLTNSLAATDVAAVHGGYARYRVPLLKGGIAIHELKPDLGPSNLSLFGSSRASLHTKAFTVDEHTGFIGSLNLDPRSASLNTEMGVVFRDPPLVERMRAIFAEEVAPDMSYRLFLDAGALRWAETWQGEERILRREPEANFSRRALAFLVGWLPLESQL